MTGKKREQEISIAELKGIGPLGDFWQSYLGESHAFRNNVKKGHLKLKIVKNSDPSESSQHSTGVDHICLFLSFGSHFVVKYNLTHRTN